MSLGTTAIKPGWRLLVWLKYTTSSKTWTKRGRILSGNQDCWKRDIAKYFQQSCCQTCLHFSGFIFPCFQRNVFLPWMENVILWSYNFAKVETSFPSLFKTLPEIAKNTRRSFLKIIRGRNMFQLVSWYSAVPSNAGWLHWWNFGQLFAACGFCITSSY